MTRQRRADRGCFFCGGRPLTREHILPNYLSAGSTSPGEQTTLRKHHWDGSGPPTLEAKDVDGSFMQRKVKEFCEPCNTGWMSLLESDVQMLLLSLLIGDPIRINVLGQRAIARWAIKTAMVRGAADSLTSVHPVEDKAAIMSDAFIPDGWSVWFASSSADLDFDRHWSMWIDRLNDAQETVREGYSQTTFQIGTFGFSVLYVDSDVNPEMQTVVETNFTKLTRIWPSSDFVSMPALQLMDEAELRQFAELLRVVLAQHTGIDHPIPREPIVKRTGPPARE
jgi:hypothetical protein